MHQEQNLAEGGLSSWKNSGISHLDLLAKVVSLKTSDDHLLLWMKTFAIRYYEYLNTWDIVSWQEQESYRRTTNSDKIIMHTSTAEEHNEEQPITVSVFISIGDMNGTRKGICRVEQWRIPHTAIYSKQPQTFDRQWTNDLRGHFIVSRRLKNLHQKVKRKTRKCLSLHHRSTQCSLRNSKISTDIRTLSFNSK